MALNKKAQMGNMMMFFVFFFILLMIAGGIVLGVSIFFGAEYDTRQAEADILFFKLEECVIKNDLTHGISQDGFFELCNLDKNAVLNASRIRILRNGVNIENTNVKGSSVDCFANGAKKNPNYPICVRGRITKQVGEEKVVYEIFAGSHQKIRRKS